MLNILGYAKMGGVVALAASLAYGAHWFIVNQKDNQIEQLKAQVTTITRQNVALETAAQLNEQTIKSLDAKIEKQNSDFGALTRKLDDITQQRDTYLSIFAKHDLTKLARVKPGLIEKSINRGTKSVFNDIEEDTKEIANADN